MYKNCVINKVRENYYTVVGDSERFGKAEILFEGSNKKQCEEFCKRTHAQMKKKNTVTHLRTVQSVIKKLDAMQKRKDRKEVEVLTIDHGVAVYEYSRYEYNPSGYRKNYQGKMEYHEESVTIYVIDFDTHKEIEYMTLNDELLRKPKDNDADYYVEFVSCVWESEFPSILFCREYTNK